MNFGGNQQHTAYFTDHATAQDAVAELEAAGISSSEITLHDQRTGGAGFLEGIKRFFEGEPTGSDGNGTLLTVNGDGAIAEPILRRYDARLGTDAPSANASYDNGASGAGFDAERTMKLSEERLTIDKQQVKAGEVHLGKEVVTERQSIDVPVAHEEVVVSRRPVRDGGYSGAAGEIGDDAEISVPVMREEVSVDKHAVVTEEVGLAKRTVSETETVGGTVRKERATISTDGEVERITDVRDR